jgi:hypothetical protein
VRPFTVGLAVFASLLVPAGTTSAQEAEARSGSPFSAFATGTALHAEALRLAVGGPTLVTAGVAVSAASTASDGLTKAISDEMGRVVQPASPAGKRSYGRGTGLELAIGGGTPLGAGLNLAGVAEATAPPTAPLLNNELGPLALDPLAYASLVRGQARPAWSDHTCVIGRPSAFGLGYVADLQLLNLGGPGPGGTFAQPLVAADAGNPMDRTVTQSRSFTYLEPNPDGSFAVVSETRQTIAPVTLFRGTPIEVTIEVLGEWVLRATASGKPGGARIQYGPAVRSGPATPVIRIVHPGGTIELTLQQILGPAGLRLAVGPLLGVAVAEPPRPIAAPGRDVDIAGRPKVSPDGTQAAGAVDVVRVSLLQPVPSGGFRLVELRLGHMEASSTVPRGGVGCRIPVRKDGAPTFVEPGGGFTWTISVPSAADAFDGLSCDLVGVSAVDTARATPGVVFTILSASNGGAIDGSTVSWGNLGRYHPGDPPIVLTIVGRVEPNSARGVLTDTVEVGASLDNCAAGVPTPPLVGKTNGVALTGAFTLDGPTVRPLDEPASMISGPRPAGSPPPSPSWPGAETERRPPLQVSGVGVALPDPDPGGPAATAQQALLAKAVRLETGGIHQPERFPTAWPTVALVAVSILVLRRRTRRRSRVRRRTEITK